MTYTYVGGLIIAGAFTFLPGRLNAIPEGCAFNPRCQHVMAVCKQDRPELFQTSTSRAACWLHKELS